MAQGRKKPRAQHITDGTYRDDRQLPDQVVPPELVTLPLAPDHLTKYAQTCWNNICFYLSENKLLTSGDLLLVEMLAINYDLVRRCYDDLKGADLVETLQGKNGEYKQKNPLHLVLLESQKEILQISKQLGLSPLARTSIGVSYSRPDDPLGDLMNAGKKGR